MIEENIENELPLWGKTKITPLQCLVFIVWLAIGGPLIPLVFHRVSQPLQLIRGLGRRAA